MSEKIPKWYTLGDTAKCRTCGDDIIFDGQHWQHGDDMIYDGGRWKHFSTSKCARIEVIELSTKRKTAVCCDKGEDHILYSAWLRIMIADGWREGNQAAGWVRTTTRQLDIVQHRHIETMTHDEAMEWFADGLTPPPMDWEDLPFSEPVGGSDGPQKPL